MNLASVKRGKSDVSTLAVSGKFEGYKPEGDKLVRKAEVVMNPVLERIGRAWKGFARAKSGKIDTDDMIADLYEQVLAKISRLRYSPADIESFSLSLHVDDGSSTKIGLFLSALMNHCQEDGFIIHTSHLPVPIHHLGYQNTKSITIVGDAGEYLCNLMEGGKAIIGGDVGNLAGYRMKDGNILVKGNVGNKAGLLMESGSIEIIGNCGDYMGDEMGSGEIHVRSDAGTNLGQMMKGGRITVEGNAGKTLGYAMQGGTIEVKGDTGDGAGLVMSGGQIKIGGNASVDLGFQMKGGEISIFGDATSVGPYMSNGIIRVNGTIGSVSEKIEGGKIFHDGEQIYPK